MNLELNSIFHSKDVESRLYNINCPIIGLTGGIATGKSSVTKLLQDKGLEVICADQLVKTIYATPEAIAFIKDNFPETIINEEIDFKTLREKVFNNDADKKLVEEFIYSKLPNTFKEKLESLSSPKVIIYDVPLLFEKELDKLVDVTVCVYCPKEIQKQRLVARDNIQEDLALKIIDSQFDIEDKKEKSDFFISNAGKEEDLAQKVEEVIELIFE